jgi:phospholipid/cholesterol/gamma-HCH transport system ATP-binding protein
VIAARHLWKSFNGRRVLEDISLEIADKETLVILGPSGQGKTVFIKTLARLIKPDAGTVLYGSQDIFRMPEREFRELQKRTAFVFQANALFDFLDVQENLALFLRMHTRLSDQDIEDRIKESVGFVGLDPSVLTKYPDELSLGMGKRVAISRALIVRPSVVFYDEPTSALDEGNVNVVIDLILSLKKEVSPTSIIVTHDVNLMWRLADHVALLREGKIIFDGDKGQVSEPMLRELYATGEDNGR